MKSPYYAGDSLSITILGITSRYSAPANEGWTAHLSIINAINAYRLDSVPAENGIDHLIEPLPATLATISPGKYQWVTYLTDASGKQQTVESGGVLIQPNPSSGAPVDLRSHAQKMLDAIEAILEGRATSGDLDMIQIHAPTLGSRGAGYSPDMLLPLRDKYRAEVLAEARAAAVARGERVSNTLKVRFR